MDGIRNGLLEAPEYEYEYDVVRWILETVAVDVRVIDW